MRDPLFTLTSRHVGVAAEAIVAAQFARIGFDISVQYGANQPEYDLAVIEGDDMLKVSVKGSKDGGWGLTQSLLRDANYQEAAEAWLKRHGRRTALCLVQFKDVRLDEMPRLYIALATDVATMLKTSRNGLGDTILHEKKAWTRGKAAGASVAIPDQWKFSRARVEEILASLAEPI
jgi:hypothetical protein